MYYGRTPLHGSGFITCRAQSCMSQILFAKSTISRKADSAVHCAIPKEGIPHTHSP